MSVWQAIERTIQKSVSNDFSIKSKQAISGGDISQAFLVSDNQKNFFVKINSQYFLNNFRQEAIGLSALQQCDQLVVPKVIGYGEKDQQSFLVQEYIRLNNTGDYRLFARGLAALHQLSGDAFGFKASNYIGSNPQTNCWSSDWGKFFVENRLLMQFEQLFRNKTFSAEIQETHDNFEKILLCCKPILNQNCPQPSLVHGDLWQGNYSFDELGEPVVYDPACYYADSEVDLAMLELFGRPSNEFYSAYYQLNPRRSGFELRKKIYNLYHLLNHANLFGHGYISQVNTTIRQILQMI